MLVLSQDREYVNTCLGDAATGAVELEQAQNTIESGEHTTLSITPFTSHYTKDLYYKHF